MADGETVAGVSGPLSKDELFADDIRNRLEGCTPETLIEEFDDL